MRRIASLWKSRRGSRSEPNRRLLLHVGFQKCGSTSLQAALHEAPGILYPRGGLNGLEHISLPLSVRGVDEWTRQYITEAWVAEQQRLMGEEIAASPLTAVVSSERLALCTPAEVERIPDYFPGRDIHVLVVIRDKAKYINTLWRHAVYRHDYPLSLEQMTERMADFSFETYCDNFRRIAPTTVISMDDPDYTQKLSDFFGMPITLGYANKGVPKELAVNLQQIHAVLGTEEFRKLFPWEVKERILQAYRKELPPPEFEPFIVPLF